MRLRRLLELRRRLLRPLLTRTAGAPRPGWRRGHIREALPDDEGRRPMPMSWCELVDAMRERRLEWDGERPWDAAGRFVPAGGEMDGGEPARTVDEALRSLPPFRPDAVARSGA